MAKEITNNQKQREHDIKQNFNEFFAAFRKVLEEDFVKEAQAAKEGEDIDAFVNRILQTQPELAEKINQFKLPWVKDVENIKIDGHSAKVLPKADFFYLMMEKNYSKGGFFTPDHIDRMLGKTLATLSQIPEKPIMNFEQWYSQFGTPSDQMDILYQNKKGEELSIKEFSRVDPLEQAKYTPILKFMQNNNSKNDISLPLVDLDPNNKYFAEHQEKLKNIMGLHFEYNYKDQVLNEEQYSRLPLNEQVECDRLLVIQPKAFPEDTYRLPIDKLPGLLNQPTSLTNHLLEGRIPVELTEKVYQENGGTHTLSEAEFLKLQKEVGLDLSKDYSLHLKLNFLQKDILIPAQQGYEITHYADSHGNVISGDQFDHMNSKKQASYTPYMAQLNSVHDEQPYNIRYTLQPYIEKQAQLQTPEDYQNLSKQDKEQVTKLTEAEYEQLSPEEQANYISVNIDFKENIYNWQQIQPEIREMITEAFPHITANFAEVAKLNPEQALAVTTQALEHYLAEHYNLTLHDTADGDAYFQPTPDTKDTIGRIVLPAYEYFLNYANQSDVQDPQERENMAHAYYEQIKMHEMMHVVGQLQNPDYLSDYGRNVRARAYEEICNEAAAHIFMKVTGAESNYVNEKAHTPYYVLAWMTNVNINHPSDALSTETLTQRLYDDIISRVSMAYDMMQTQLQKEFPQLWQGQESHYENIEEVQTIIEEESTDFTLREELNHSMV